MASLARARPGTAALLVLMASSGAVLGFGHRDGDLLRGFRLLGRLLLEGPTLGAAVSSLTALPRTTPLLGALHHVTVALAWGFLLGLLVRPFRGLPFALVACGGAFAFSLLAFRVLPPLVSVGFATVNSPARAVPFAMAIAVALLVTPWASGVGKDGSGG
jgi:hypothetical protein